MVGGTLRAGDDALDARFVDRAALGALPLVTELLVTPRRSGTRSRREVTRDTPAVILRATRRRSVLGTGRPGCSPPRASP